jgi:GWxTD domain-containing protein
MLRASSLPVEASTVMLSFSAKLGVGAVAAWLWAVAWAGPAAGASGPGFSLGEETWHLEGENLDTDALFARVDSLEDQLGHLEGDDRERAQMRLAQLYLSTGLIKHRRHALSLLEEILAEKPKSYEAAALWATMAQRMRYISAARDRLERSVEEFDDDPRPATHLGRFYFREARRRDIQSAFQRAESSFRQAVYIDPEFVPAWRGLATTRLALQEFEGALSAARRWQVLEPDVETPRWIEAASLVGLDSLDRAQACFAPLLEGADPSVREVFEGERGLLNPSALEEAGREVLPRRVVQRLMREAEDGWTVVDHVDWGQVMRDSTAHALAVDHYWQQHVLRPTKAYNAGKLIYWRRLVEADVLFGDPSRGVRGWNTEMGDAWSRWGRPTSTFYDAGGASGILGDLDAAGVKLRPGDSVPQNTRIWVWTYKRPGDWFSLMFTDPTMNSRWLRTSVTNEYVAARTRVEPVSFPGGDGDRPSPYRLTLSSAVFPRTSEASVLESYLRVDVVPAAAAALAEHPDSLAVVEWALFDDLNHRIDFRREVLGAEARLSGLVGGTDDPASPLVWTLGARVEPGDYRIAVEVSDARGGGRRAATFETHVREPGPPGFLDLSDVQLTRRLDPYEEGADISPRYVKFRQIVVPAPSHRFEEGDSELGVYFEVRGVGLDDTGQTSLDVVYEVFDDRQSIRSQVSAREFRRDDLQAIDPLTSVFLNERTGVSREGVVVKGTELPLDSLGRGSFLVLVTVSDRISGQSASRATWFRRSRSR